VKMLHDHRLLSNSCSKTPRHHHQSHVGHVTWTGYDVITRQCESTSCFYGRSNPAPYSVPPITDPQWPCHMQTSATDWVSMPSAAVAAASTSWGRSTRTQADDRAFSCAAAAALPHSLSTAELGVNYVPGVGVVPDWQLNHSEQRWCAAKATSFTYCGVGGASVLNAPLATSSHNSEPQRPHQLSTLEHHQRCSASSSLQVAEDDQKCHQFGTRPTRASTSIGNFVFTVAEQFDL